MPTSKKVIFALLILTPSVVLAACGSDTDDSASDSADAASTSIEDLVAAAQEEGSFTFYSSPPEKASQALADTFADKYDLDVQMVRLVSSEMEQRFASETSADAPSADLLLDPLSAFHAEAIDEGWVLPIADAEIPDFPWDFPSQFLLPDSGTAIVQLIPFGIAYNTDLVDAGDAPETWEDLLDPQWHGQLGIADPSSSVNYYGALGALQEHIGDDFLVQLGQQEPAIYGSGVPAVNALGAGEFSVLPLTSMSLVNEVKEAGAPVEYIDPSAEWTNSVTVLIAAKAENPNAAKLFTHYVMSEEGSVLLAEETGGGISPYDAETMADRTFFQWTPEAEERKDDVLQQLGLQ